MKKSQVYTKTGDKGLTSLIGGTRVQKHHIRLEAYGTVDELNAHVGMLRSFEIGSELVDALVRVQNQLFIIGSYLATDETVSDMRVKLVTHEVEIEFMETEMDRMEQFLPVLNNFVLPGGHPALAQCHVARTVCRRAERRVNAMAAEVDVDHRVIKYLNRLSDYFFVLSRYLSNYFKVDEIRWVSGL